MEYISPVVLNSKMAKDNLNKIKLQHGDILLGMANQKTRVDAYNTQQAQEAAQEKIIQEKAAQDQIERDMKMQELEIKRIALAD